MPILNTVYLNGCNYQIGYDLNSQNINNDTSKVRFYGILNVTNSYVSWSHGTAQVWSFVSNLATRYNRGSYVVVEGVATLNHNQDGTYSAELTGSLNTTFTSGTTSAWFTLPTIARKSSISNKNGTIGDKMTISWNRASDNFTHTLTYKFGNAMGTIGTNLTTSIDWTPPKELYQYFKNSKSGTGTLTLTTFNGSNNLGSNTSTLTLNSKEVDCTPSVNSNSIKDINDKTIALTNDNSTIILYKSNVECLVNFNINEYASLKSIVLNGIDVLSSVTESTSTDESVKKYLLNYTINEISSKEIKIVIVDSRDYSIEVTIVPTKIIEYVPLSANVQMKRPQPTTGEISTSFSGNYYNGKFNNIDNELKLSYVYKKEYDEEYSERIYFTKETDYKIIQNTFQSINEISLGTMYDYRNTYNFIFYYEDKLSSGQVNITVNKGIPIVNWNGNKFNINGDLHINNEPIITNENDKIILSGSVYVGEKQLEKIQNLEVMTIFEGSDITGTFKDESGNTLNTEDFSYLIFFTNMNGSSNSIVEAVVGNTLNIPSLQWFDTIYFTYMNIELKQTSFEVKNRVTSWAYVNDVGHRDSTSVVTKVVGIKI